jgi:carbonic anhydrase
MKHTCDAIVIHCIDFRFQKFLNEWLNTNVGIGKFDRVSLAGGIFDIFAILKQVEISNRLHKIKKVILINHEDCGAYGEAGTYQKHLDDLSDAKRKIKSLLPHLNVETYYLHLDGNFEKIL